LDSCCRGFDFSWWNIRCRTAAKPLEVLQDVLTQLTPMQGYGMCCIMDSETKRKENHSIHNRYLVAFDSDGTVFDSMERKQHRCYFPRFIQYFQLKPFEDIIRPIWDDVNLNSMHRGCNRYIAITHVMDQLIEHPDIIAKNVELPDFTHLRYWISMTSEHTLESLMEFQKEHRFDETIRTLIAWSQTVDKDLETRQFAKLFPAARQVLGYLKHKADVAVVSHSPQSLLHREWNHAGLASFAKNFYGQDYGSKTELLQLLVQDYPEKKSRLYVGDSMGDLEAARKAGMLFFPIFPGNEEKNWRELLDRGLPRFFAGEYDGMYEDVLIILFTDIHDKSGLQEY
jgi:phosphoglycolate phosphatase-like HAD superfamily hydrolase